MPDNCSPDNCPVNARVDALEKEFDRYRGNSTETHRQMFGRIGSLEQSGAAVREKLDGMDEKLDKLTETTSALAGKSGKRWDSLADKVVWAVCAAVIAFLLSKVGL